MSWTSFRTSSARQPAPLIGALSDASGGLRVGFAVLQYEQLSRDFGPWVKPTAARLNAIAVRPDAHGRGIGRRLLESVIDAARRRPSLSLSLSTGERNTRARRLFTGGGFVQLARVEGYYDGGQTGVLMHRALID